MREAQPNLSLLGENWNPVSIRTHTKRDAQHGMDGLHTSIADILDAEVDTADRNARSDSHNLSRRKLKRAGIERRNFNASCGNVIPAGRNIFEAETAGFIRLG